MKAWLGALLLGAAGASASWAQSPAFNQLTPAPPFVPVPFMPDLPSIATTPSRAGAQLPASSVALPPPPIVGAPSFMAAPPNQPFTAVDLNAPYDVPFVPPNAEPTFLGDGAPPPPNGNAKGPRLWLNADYLFWFIKDAPQPNPLVVTGPATDRFPGALDQPGTRVLYGGKGLAFNPFSGMRLSLGLWTGHDNRFGFELAGFVLEQKANQFRASGGATGNPFLARPFIDAITGAENVYFVSQNFADPVRSAFMTGGVEVSSKSRLWGYEINGLYNITRSETTSVSLIGGFSSVGLREKLHISESLQNLVPGGGVTFLGAGVDPSTRVWTYDKFDAENSFYGYQLGSRIHFESGQWGLDLIGKAAIGVMQQQVDIQGQTAVDAPNGKYAAIAPGGVYAVASNMGRHYETKFGFVPQGNINLSYALNDSIILKLGYSGVYLNSVARPGAQINRTVNPTLVPSDATYGTLGGPFAPPFHFQTSSFWAQGVNLGLEVRY